MEDIEQTFNTATPVVYGGTGATDKAGARTNIAAVGYDSDTPTASEQAQARANIGLTNGYPLLHVQDERVPGVDGGPSPTAAFIVRTLNTLKVNEITGASVGANQITLPAGTYWIEVDAPAYASDRTVLLLQRPSDSAVLIYGKAAFAYSLNFGYATCLLSGRFTLTTPAAVQILHQFQTGSALGLGLAPTGGFIPVYASAKVWKLK